MAIMAMHKRAPGGGRKPQGEFKGKSATLTTRITQQTRQQLEHASRKNGLSLSQEVERRLVRSFRLRSRRSAITALAEAISMVADNIERATENTWENNAFTAAALRHGLEFLLSHFAPPGAPTVPPKITETAAKIPPELGERYKTPYELGLIEAGRVITAIETAPNGELLSPVNTLSSPDEWLIHCNILRDIGSGWKRSLAPRLGDPSM
jgi:hypothetical protein